MSSLWLVVFLGPRVNTNERLQDSVAVVVSCKLETLAGRGIYTRCTRQMNASVMNS